MCAHTHSTAAVETRDWKFTVVVLLLCASVWRGPIPVVHRHAAADAADASGQLFWSHWTDFHAASTIKVDAEQWHVHFGFPWTFAGGACDSDSGPIPAPQESDAAAFSVTSWGELPAGSNSDLPASPESIVIDSGRGSLREMHRCREGGGFLRSYSPDAPLCILTGVVLC